MTVYPVNISAPVISSAVASPASITLPVTGTSLDATTSDPDGDTLTHEWDFDHGGSFTVDASTGTTQTVNHTYADDGDYEVNVTVTVGQVLTGVGAAGVGVADNTGSTNITINNVDPVIDSPSRPQPRR